jgi:hypothetical protein
MTFIVSTTDSPYEVWSGPDPLGVLVTSNRMARTDAQRMAGVDVKRTLRDCYREHSQVGPSLRDGGLWEGLPRGL